jgi:hypothetical protein
MIITYHVGSINITINKRSAQGYFPLDCIKEQFSKGYIIFISLKGFISSIIKLKEHSRQPMEVAFL